MARPRRADRRGRPRRELAPVMRKAPRTPLASTTVDAIVEAAEAVLERDGIDALTTNRVAEQAGVSIGTLYQYFPNKFALASAIFDRHRREYEAVFVGAVASHRDVYDIIVAVGEGLLDIFARRPNIHRSLRVLRSAAEVHERIDAMLTSMIGAMAAVVAASGEAAERARDIAFVLVHAADGVANAIATSSDREQGRRVIAVFAEMASSLYPRG